MDVETRIGAKVRKHFEGHGWFTGEVVSFDRKGGFYKVRYEDDDREEYTPEQLQPILISFDDNTEKENDTRIGAKVRKHFEGHGWFTGEVISFDRKGGFYKVRYEDDDHEEYTPEQLQPILVSSDDTTEKENEVRRSTRNKTSTLVYINGQAVKKENNYRLKGLSYVFGNNDNDSNRPKREATKTKKAAAFSRKPKKKAPPRTLPPSEKKRKSHNDAIQKRIHQKRAVRLNFLSHNLSTMEPFLENKVIRHLSQASSAENEEDTTELYMQPDGIQAELRDYQLEGLSWMVKMHKLNLGMILGDEMGLGKTLQTISLLCHLKEHEGISGPSLVVCPLSVLYSWCDELERWAPNLKFLRLHSSCADEREAQRLSLVNKATEFDVVVTTYEMVKSPSLRSLWTRQAFHYVVLDEGHRIKDASSQTSQAVRGIHSENRLILTGTPLQNNLVELWALLNYLHPDVFASSETFAKCFDLTENIVDKETVLLAHNILSLFMLRRLKDEVEKLMPKKVETKVICPLSNMQVWWYKALLLKDINLLARSSEEANDSPSMASKNVLRNLVMQLRKCCIHPFLFQGAEADIDSTSCQDLVAASGKLTVLDMLLRSLHEKKHRVVLFSQFTSALDILDDYCTLRGWKHCRFDGSTPRAQRNFIVNQFNAPESEFFIFLMSTRSGGMGLNLQTADTCILFDSDWNPQPDLQAAARVHRIGQKKTVHVYRLVCGGTIEERMVERAQKKLWLDQMVNQDSAPDDLQVSKGELMSTLKFGCDAVFAADSKNQNALPTAEDIAAITDRDRSDTYSSGRLKGGTTNNVSDFKADEKFTSTTKLGGIDFKTIRSQYEQNKKLKGTPTDIGDITHQWMKLQKRERKNRIIYVEGEGYGSKNVPVLAANNYELEEGERSVFQRELGGRGGNFGGVKKNVKRSGVDFDVQIFCQVCGDGGTLLCCPRCPVCVHQECVGVSEAKHLLSCPHHRCSNCQKNVQASGGLLFPCQSCPSSFCEDCLPKENKGFRILGECDRFSKLGYANKNFCYVHCSESCEQYAIQEFKWSIPSMKSAPTPAPLDISYAFGKPIDDTIDAPAEEVCTSRLRKRKVLNNSNLEDQDTPSVDRNIKHKSGDDASMEGKAKQPKPYYKPAAKPAPKPVLKATGHLSSTGNGEYEVTVPVTPYGLQMKIGSNGTCVWFAGYRKNPDGSKGPLELTKGIRNVGDRLIAVDGVGTTSLPLKQVAELMKAGAQNKPFVVLRFSSVAYSSKYSSANMMKHTLPDQDPSKSRA